jgi:hypothetical protein
MHMFQGVVALTDTDANQGTRHRNRASETADTQRTYARARAPRWSAATLWNALCVE